MGKKKRKKCGHYSGIGGQAVLEGVMMKNKEEYAVSVRKPDGLIETKKDRYEGVWGDHKLTQLPFLRGIFNFIDSLVLGMQAMRSILWFRWRRSGISVICWDGERSSV